MKSEQDRHPVASRRRRLLMLAAALVTVAPAAAQDVGVPVGAPAPDAAVQDLRGRPARLLQHVPRGKPAIIEFWAVWCGECARLQPQLDRIHARYRDRVTIVAVAVGVSQSLRRVNRHLERDDPGYTFLWDANGAAVRSYEAQTTSTIVILDHNGRVAYAGTGGDQDLVPVVQRVLARR